MIGLAIHTSSPELGLALIDLDRATQRSQVWPLGRDLIAYLHDCLADFLSTYRWSDLAYIAVSRGPGGFTGTRIGVVVARTLAQQLQIPLFGVSSLAAIAQQYQLTSAPKVELTQVAIALPAQRGEMFGASYQTSTPVITTVLAEALYAHADWEAQLNDGATPHHLIKAAGGLGDSVEGVLAIAQHQWQIGDRPDWSSVLPFYGQHPVQK